MKKLSFLAIFSLMLVGLLSSCGSECKTCTGTVVTVIDDGTGSPDTSETTIAEEELCDLLLIAAETAAVPVVTTVDSTTTTVTTSYVCE